METKLLHINVDALSTLVQKKKKNLQGREYVSYMLLCHLSFFNETKDANRRQLVASTQLLQRSHVIF